jgi:hypothetical protein
MKTKAFLLSGIVILSLILTIAPASAIMAAKSGDGVSRGDYNTLAIYEAKDTYKKSEGAQYVTPWVSIVPGSDKACGDRSLTYRYRILTPDGKNYNQVVYGSTFDAGNGLLLSGNMFAFTQNRAADWLEVGTLINNANRKGFAWPGTWTVEFYFGNYDCKQYEYTDWKLVSTKTFTLVDDSAAAMATPQQATYTTTVSTPAVTYTSAAPGGSFTGDWSTSYGPMILVQSGSEVTGTYDYNGKYSTVAGTMSGNVLTGTWTEPGRDGDFQFVLSADGKSFSGKWRYRGSSDWTGTWTGTRTATATTIPATRTPVAATTVPPQTTRQIIQSTISQPVVTQPLTRFSSCSGTGPVVYVEDRVMEKGRTVTIPVMMCNAQDVANMDLTVTYDTSVLSFSGATKGSLNANSLFESNEPSRGTIKISFASSSGFSGTGSIALLTFNVIGPASSTTPIKVSITTASTSAGKTLDIPVTAGNFKVGTPLTGDFDGDNQLTARDALAALQISVGKRAMDTSLDVNKDNSVNSVDAREILKMVVKKS